MVISGVFCECLCKQFTGEYQSILMTFKYDLNGGVKKGMESCSGDYTLLFKLSKSRFCPQVKSVEYLIIFAYQTALNWMTVINFCPYHLWFIRPRDDKATDLSHVSKTFTCVRYAVCSGPKQFSAYLKGILNQLMGFQKYLHCNLQRFWVAGAFYEPVKREQLKMIFKTKQYFL